MDKNQKEDVVSKTEINASLNETDLESVSGGFTLIDTCQNRWAELICAEAIWGVCPHLDMKRVRVKAGNFDNVIYYSVSCDKGCFKDVSYKERLDDF
jgi:hypothetical protein